MTVAWAGALPESGQGKRFGGSHLRVAIDFQSVVKIRSGIGQYVYSLAKYLPIISPSDRFVCLSFGGKGDSCGDLRAPNLEWRRFPHLPARLMSLLWKRAGWPPADFFTGRVDVFHFPGFIARPTRSCRTVVTIHDLAFKRMPECAEEKNAAFLESNMPRTLDRARLAIVDSEFTRRELMDCYGYPAERIRVVHLGVEDVFRPLAESERSAVRSRYGLPGGYILWVGTLEPRKDVGSLVKAYALLRGAGRELPKLLLVGAAGWRREPEKIDRLVRELRLEGSVIRLPYLPGRDLPAVYAAADLFVFPSLYEGFGLPPLEAMASGTPVVCTDAPALPEVAGDAAMFAPPREPERLAGAIQRVLTDQSLRRRLIGLGLERAKRFSWVDAARKVMDAYRDAL